MNYASIIMYFAWEDQRDKECFINHKVANVLYEKYSTVDFTPAYTVTSKECEVAKSKQHSL